MSKNQEERMPVAEVRRNSAGGMAHIVPLVPPEQLTHGMALYSVPEVVASWVNTDGLLEKAYAEGRKDEREAADAEYAIQGGLDNDELLQAWGRKVPGVSASEEELRAFALGVEVGDVMKRVYFDERNSARDAWRARQKEVEQAHRWAHDLAVSMASRFYPEVTHWEPLPDLVGLLTQIDNMTTGLERKQCVHKWMVVRQGQMWMDSRCDKCGETKHDGWD